MLLILLLEGEYLFETLSTELGLLPTPLFSLAHHHIMIIVFVCISIGARTMMKYPIASPLLFEGYSLENDNIVTREYSMKF